MTPKLLVLELWGVGDLAIAGEFLKAACEHYQVTLLAKPHAYEFQPRFWPAVNVIPVVAPWTAFRHKYRLFQWPWPTMVATVQQLRSAAFDVAVSARWDPRDHVLLALSGARRRIGFARLGSGCCLTDRLPRPPQEAHRSEYWRALARTLSLDLPAKGQTPAPERAKRDLILIHSGAGQPVRVWPLDRFRNLLNRLRRAGYRVKAVCDADQREWWQAQGEPEVVTPRSLAELLTWLDEAGAFVGNDSGAGHLAALCGVPTFTIFGPQLPEWFAPLHSAAEWIEGKPCPYKPCFDNCRFPQPHCIQGVTEEEVSQRVEVFLRKLALARGPKLF